jgi:hypothetical protein
MSRCEDGSFHKRCSIVGTMIDQATRSAAMSASASAASKRGIVTTQLPRNSASTAALNDALW